MNEAIEVLEEMKHEDWVGTQQYIALDVAVKRLKLKEAQRDIRCEHMILE